MFKINDQLKKDFNTFWNFIQKADKITICTHIEPDGDTLGTAIALQELINLNLKDKNVKISGGDYPRNISFLIDEPISLVSDDFFQQSLKVVVDTSTKRRIYDQRVKTEESIKFDHHHNEGEWLFGIGGDFWPATGEALVLLINEIGLRVNPKIITALAVAILTDTENLVERNISDQTFLCMAYLMQNGLNYQDTIRKLSLNDDEKTQIFRYLNMKKTIDGIDVLLVNELVTNDIARPLAALFTSFSSSGVCFLLLKKKDGNYRGEIRSKEMFDVSQVASFFGGGGHFHSAGFILDDINRHQEVVNKINELKMKN
ncbi:DHH family phosphoesterase [Ureaplasma canigenitalium]|uniref:DHH family phosphoesterase n=1 Tax=Ureaplasma canigenitalium TaxID=42092 RepID=UPI0004E10874|nr:DHHA1 domain-containing protein [Ureaplasma canigenitalium]